MRRNIVILLSVTVFSSSCAYQGVVVEKRFRPVPFTYSLGMEAMYNLQLRDNAGQTNSQMVTPDVFANYRVGDYFNDMQAPPAHDEKELEGFRLPPPDLRDEPYQPVKVMQMQSPQRAATKVAVHAPSQSSGDVKILRWQTVRILPISSQQTVAARVAVRVPGQTSDMKILRGGTARILPIQSPEKIAARIAGHAPNQSTGEVRIPRWQIVSVAPTPSQEKTAVKVALPASHQITGDVKILRWQTVRIVPIQSPQKVAAKVPAPAQPRATSVVKTASAHNGDIYNYPAKTADLTKNGVKVASKSHHKTVASVN